MARKLRALDAPLAASLGNFEIFIAALTADGTAEDASWPDNRQQDVLGAKISNLRDDQAVCEAACCVEESNLQEAQEALSRLQFELVVAQSAARLAARDLRRLRPLKDEAEAKLSQILTERQALMEEPNR